MEIVVKRFSEQDVEERVSWINNPLINKAMFFELPASVERTLKWYLSNKENNRRIDFSFFDSRGVCIAMGGFVDISEEHKNAEFYIMVNPLLHGKGIGKKTSEWIYNYGFSVLDFNKIYLYTNDDNEAAYRIYEKYGFQLEGILRKHKWKQHKFQDRRFYGLLRTEWEQSEWRKYCKDEL